MQYIFGVLMIAGLIAAIVIGAVNVTPDGPEARAEKACEAYRAHLGKPGEHYSLEYFAQEYRVPVRLLRGQCK